MPRIPLFLGVLAGLISCGTADEVDPTAVCETATTRVGVLTEMTFARIEAGQSVGFDLDGHTTMDGMSEGCGVADLTHPDGTTGIDNALGGLVPALELTEAAAVEDIIQQTINMGELIILMEMRGVDDAMNDDCVDLTLHRGYGAPMVGTDNRLISGQTFDLDPSVAQSHSPGATIVDGMLFAENLDVEFPLEFFDARLEALLEKGKVRVDFAEDGSFTGYLGGTFDYNSIVEMAQNSGVDDNLANALPALFANVADLEPNEFGECTRISVTFEFKGTSAFIYDEPPDGGVE